MKGKKVQDIWDFKDTHRQVYPTEKSERLLDRIINSSSLPGSIVLDFFAWSGTTLVAAEKSWRKWIGVDQSNEAIRVAKEKLSKNIRQDNQETLFEFIDIVTNP